MATITTIIKDVPTTLATSIAKKVEIELVEKIKKISGIQSASINSLPVVKSYEKSIEEFIGNPTSLESGANYLLIGILIFIIWIFLIYIYIIYNL